MSFEQHGNHLFFHCADDGISAGKKGPLGYQVQVPSRVHLYADLGPLHPERNTIPTNTNKDSLPRVWQYVMKSPTSSEKDPKDKHPPQLEPVLLTPRLERSLTLPPLPHSPKKTQLGLNNTTSPPKSTNKKEDLVPPSCLSPRQRKGLQRPFDKISKLRKAPDKFSVYCEHVQPVKGFVKHLAAYEKLTAYVEGERTKILIKRQEEAALQLMIWTRHQQIRDAIVETQKQEKQLREQLLMEFYTEFELLVTQEEEEAALVVDAERRVKLSRDREERHRRRKEENEEKDRLKSEEILGVLLRHSRSFLQLYFKMWFQQINENEVIFRRHNMELQKVTRDALVKMCADNVVIVQEYYRHKAECERELNKLAESEETPRRQLGELEALVRYEMYNEFLSVVAPHLLRVGITISKEFQVRLRKATGLKWENNEMKARTVVLEDEAAAWAVLVDDSTKGVAVVLGKVQQRMKRERDECNAFLGQETAARNVVADAENKMRTKFLKMMWFESQSLMSMMSTAANLGMSEGANVFDLDAEKELRHLLSNGGGSDVGAPGGTEERKLSRQGSMMGGVTKRKLVVDDIRDLMALGSRPTAMYGCGEVHLMRKVVVSASTNSSIESSSAMCFITLLNGDVGDRLYLRTVDKPPKGVDINLRTQNGKLFVAGEAIGEYDSTIGGGDHSVGIKLYSNAKTETLTFLLRQAVFMPSEYLEGMETLKLKNIRVEALVAGCEFRQTLQVVCLAPYLHVKPLHQVATLPLANPEVYPFLNVVSPLLEHSDNASALKNGLLQIALEDVSSNMTCEIKWSDEALLENVLVPLTQQSSANLLVARIASVKLDAIVEGLRTVVFRCTRRDPQHPQVRLQITVSEGIAGSTFTSVTTVYVAIEKENSNVGTVLSLNSSNPIHNGHPTYRGNCTTVNSEGQEGVEEIDTRLYFAQAATFESIDPEAIFASVKITAEFVSGFKGDYINLHDQVQESSTFAKPVVLTRATYPAVNITATIDCASHATAIEEVLHGLYFCRHPRMNVALIQGIRTLIVKVTVTAPDGSSHTTSERMEIRVAAPLITITSNIINYMEKSGSRRLNGIECPREKMPHFDGIYKGGFLHINLVRGQQEEDIVAFTPLGDFTLEPSRNIIKYGQRILGTLKLIPPANEPSRVVTIQFDPSGTTPISKRIVQEVLRCITYSHEGSDPLTKKLLRFSLSDGRGGLSQAFVVLEITPIDDPAVIQLQETMLTYHPGCARALKGYCLFEKGRILDPDTTHVQASGAYLHVELIGGGASDGTDILGYLSAEQQEMYRDPKQHPVLTITDLPEGKITTPDMEIIGFASRKSMMGRHTYGSLTGTLLIMFTAPVKIATVEYLMQCITYEFTGPTTTSGYRAFQVRYNEGGGKADVTERLSLTIKPQRISCPSYATSLKYREMQPPISLIQRADVHLSEKDSLAGSFLRVEISKGGNPTQDVLWASFDPKTGEFPISMNQDGVISLAPGRQFLGKLTRNGVGGLLLTFPPESVAKAKHLSALCKSITYSNTSKNPTTDLRHIDVMFAYAPEITHDDFSTQSLIRVTLVVIPTDDMTEFNDMPNTLLYVTSPYCEPMLALCPHASVTDPDTYMFEAPHSYLTVEIIAGATVGDVLTLWSPDESITITKQHQVIVDNMPIGTVDRANKSGRVVFTIKLENCPIEHLQKVVRTVCFSAKQTSRNQMKRVQISCRGGPTVQPTIHRIELTAVRPMIDIPPHLRLSKVPIFPNNVFQHVKLSDTPTLFDGAMLTVQVFPTGVVEEIVMPPQGYQITSTIDTVALTFDPQGVICLGEDPGEIAVQNMDPGSTNAKKKGKKMEIIGTMVKTGRHEMQIMFSQLQRATASIVLQVLASIQMRWELALPGQCVAVAVSLDLNPMVRPVSPINGESGSGSVKQQLMMDGSSRSTAIFFAALEQDSKRK
eukprot:PhF_6_TR1933/c0_g1_i1/m.3027